MPQRRTCEFQYTPGGERERVAPGPLPDAGADEPDHAQAEDGGEEGIDAEVGIVAQDRGLDGAERADLRAGLVRYVTRTIRHLVDFSQLG